MVFCSKNSLTQHGKKPLFLESYFLHQDFVMYSHKNTSCKVRIVATLKINSVRYEKK